MKFKGQLVFVETDAAGEMVLTGGRAAMRYRLEDDRIYQPWPGNLSEPDDAKGAAGAKIAQSGPSPAAVSPSSGGSRQGGSRQSPKRSKSSDRAVIAYTDGACIGNPGPSGLGYVVTWPDGRRVVRGEPLGHGTNNIAELTAILRVLDVVKDVTQPVEIFTDSEYAIGVLARKWKAKANQALIMEIRKALARFEKVGFHKVAGHSGIRENELVDQLAREAAQGQRPVGSGLVASKEE